MAQITVQNKLDPFLRSQAEGGWGVPDWVSDTVLIGNASYSTSDVLSAIQGSSLDQQVKDAFDTKESVLVMLTMMASTDATFGVSTPRKFTFVNGTLTTYNRSNMPKAFAGQDQVGASSPATMDAFPLDTVNGQVGTWLIHPDSDLGGSFNNINDPEAQFSGNASSTYKLVWLAENPDGTSTSDVVEISFA